MTTQLDQLLDQLADIQDEIRRLRAESLDDGPDLFDDDFISARRGAGREAKLPKALADLDEDEIAQLDNKHRAIRNRSKSTRRKPENKQQNSIRDHLFKHYGAVTTRVNSGEWIDEEGHTIRGAEAGTSDVLACVPIRIGALTLGIYFAFEVKSLENRSQGTDKQQHFIARVKANGGYGAIVRTVFDVDQVIATKRQNLIDELRAFVQLVIENQQKG